MSIGIDPQYEEIDRLTLGARPGDTKRYNDLDAAAQLTVLHAIVETAGAVATLISEDAGMPNFISPALRCYSAKPVDLLLLVQALTEIDPKVVLDDDDEEANMWTVWPVGLDNLLSHVGTLEFKAKQEGKP